MTKACMECGDPITAGHIKAKHERARALRNNRYNGSENEHTHTRKGTEFKHGTTEATITGYECACPEPDAATRPSVILDPFGGTGTTAMVARALGRYGISMDLSSDYLRLAEWRIWHSGHAAKSRARSNTDAQGVLL